MPSTLRAVPAAPYVSILPYAVPVSLTAHLRGVQQRGLRRSATVTWLTAQLVAIDNTDRHAYLTLSCTLPNGEIESSAKAVLWQFRKHAVLSDYRTRTRVELAAGQHVLAQVRAKLDIRFGFVLEVLDLYPFKPPLKCDCDSQSQSVLGQLQAEGLANLNQSLPPPIEIRRVAVIAPEGSAGLEDFLATLSVPIKDGLVEVKVVSAVFQGPGTAKSMRHAFGQVAIEHALSPLNLVVVLRGGGAAYDLAWLNAPNVARCVANCPVPVWTGIGHERNRTVLDEVAHTSFGRPSKVAAAVLSLVTSPTLLATGGAP